MALSPVEVLAWQLGFYHRAVNPSSFKEQAGGLPLRKRCHDSLARRVRSQTARSPSIITSNSSRTRGLSLIFPRSWEEFEKEKNLYPPPSLTYSDEVYAQALNGSDVLRPRA